MRTSARCLCLPATKMEMYSALISTPRLRAILRDPEGCFSNNTAGSRILSSSLYGASAPRAPSLPIPLMMTWKAIEAPSRLRMSRS